MVQKKAKRGDLVWWPFKNSRTRAKSSLFNQKESLDIVLVLNTTKMPKAYATQVLYDLGCFQKRPESSCPFVETKLNIIDESETT